MDTDVFFLPVPAKPCYHLLIRGLFVIFLMKSILMILLTLIILGPCSVSAMLVSWFEGGAGRSYLNHNMKGGVVKLGSVVKRSQSPVPAARQTLVIHWYQ